MFSHASVEWGTPPDLFRDLDKEFHFDFDPCPLHSSEDGLLPLFTSWKGRRVFCNPPYGPPITEWLKRADEAEIAVFLIPARTDTRWFHELVLPKAKEIRFFRGRLHFKGPYPAPFPSMLVIFENIGGESIAKSMPSFSAIPLAQDKG